MQGQYTSGDEGVPGRWQWGEEMIPPRVSIWRRSKTGVSRDGTTRRKAGAVRMQEQRASQVIEVWESGEQVFWEVSDPPGCEQGTHVGNNEGYRQREAGEGQVAEGPACSEEGLFSLRVTERRGAISWSCAWWQHTQMAFYHGANVRGGLMMTEKTVRCQVPERIRRQWRNSANKLKRFREWTHHAWVIRNRAR